MNNEAPVVSLSVLLKLDKYYRRFVGLIKINELKIKLLNSAVKNWDFPRCLLFLSIFSPVRPSNLRCAERRRAALRIYKDEVRVPVH
jgi:hypothetical protein